MKHPTTFRYTESDQVATITLDRPDRLNALTFDVYAELRDLFADLATREAVRAVIITGEGRGFCSGGDVEAIIGKLLEQDMTRLLAFTRMTGALIARIRALLRAGDSAGMLYDREMGMLLCGASAEQAARGSARLEQMLED